MLLDARGIECSTGSACSAGVPQPSHVLLAMGCDAEAARHSLRFSLGHSSTQADVDAVVEAIGPRVERARAAKTVKVLAAMSGGVDSAVAAARAVEAGHDVTGIHLALSRNPASYRSGARGCCTIEDANDARRAADVIGIPFYVWDLSDRFHEDVVEDFMDEYAAGRTPNPCLRCNEKIKFAAVLDRALGLGFEAVATGHYAQLRTGRRRAIEMHRAVDHGKDQSYVLGVLDQEQLRHSLFPLGGSTKSGVRAEAAERGLLVADKPDSHDICFVANGDTPGWLREKLGERAPNQGGAILDESGEELGRHDGTYGFTIGQRKGLRLGRPAADGKPRFVLDIEPVSGTVTVGPRERLAVHRLTGIKPRWCGAPPARLEGPDVSVQLRAHGDRAPRGGHGQRRRRRGRAARPGVRHRARPGRGRLRRHPSGRVGDDREHGPCLTSSGSGSGAGRYDVVGAGRRRAGAGRQPDEGAGRDGGDGPRPRREGAPCTRTSTRWWRGSGSSSTRTATRTRTPGPRSAAPRRCASCGGGRSCSPATSPPTWSWSRPGWRR